MLVYVGADVLNGKVLLEEMIPQNFMTNNKVLFKYK
jgi:hypothetical protein